MRSVCASAGTSRLKGFVLALACAVCAGLGTPVVALARGDDAAATRAYLRASDAYARIANTEVAASVAAIEARTEEIVGGCPSALTYAPRDEAFGELGEEAGTTASWAGAVLMRSTELRMADAIAHLRWSDRRLTSLVHSKAVEERAIATIALPDVCADIARWKASAYATLPQSSIQFLARVQAIEFLSFVGFTEESRDAMIMLRLRRYERPADRRAAERIERLGTQFGRRIEAATAAARAKLAAGLGVQTL
jgi:hypothetical protein